MALALSQVSEFSCSLSLSLSVCLFPLSFLSLFRILTCDSYVYFLCHIFTSLFITALSLTIFLPLSRSLLLFQLCGDHWTNWNALASLHEGARVHWAEPKRHVEPADHVGLPDAFHWCLSARWVIVVVVAAPKSHLGQGKQDILINPLLLPLTLRPAGPGDPTRLLGAAKSTELFGTVAMLAGCVVPKGKFYNAS